MVLRARGQPDWWGALAETCASYWSDDETLRQLGRRNEEDFYPKVKENAWTPESRNSIVNVLSATLPFCLMS